jgi:hypothetical protein
VQPEQPDEEPPEDLRPEPEPMEKPKDDIFFLGLVPPHFGQLTASSVLKTRHSKSSPQFSQLYS